MMLLAACVCWCASALQAPTRTSIAGHPVRRVVDDATNLFVYAVVFGEAAAPGAAAHDALATQLWPSGRAAARAIEALPAFASVLELGAGTALPSLAAARRGARALATDRDATCLDYARAGAADQGLALETRVFDVADFSEPLPPADLVVLADVFVTDAVAAACARRCGEALRRGSRCLVADARRSTRDAFLRALRAEDLAGVASAASLDFAPTLGTGPCVLIDGEGA